jgi:hypothetical protein
MTPYRIILAGTLILLSIPALANEAHHPAGAAGEPPAAAAPAAPGKSGADTMTSGTMMGGMMSNEMMSDEMMMNMMSGRNSPMGIMMSPDHVEGRIAFLQTELKLTDKQEHLWHQVADALRDNARSVKEMMAAMPQEMMSEDAASDTPLTKIDAYERMLSTRLEALHRLKAALDPFYATLNDTQKTVADKLLVPAPMGMM